MDTSKIKSQIDIEWSTLGQNGAKQLLSNFLSLGSTDKLPHAFLFLGPMGVGKSNFAKEFARKTFEMRAAKPEIFEYDFNDNPSIESLRELISLSNLTSVGQKKVFILNNFQKASQSSVNSLLKTLEEPSSSSMFLLISNSNRVLPTVMSRCIVVRCFSVSGQDSSLDLPLSLQELVSPYPQLSERLSKDEDLANLLSDNMAFLQKGGLSIVNKLSDLESDQLTLLLQLWTEYLKQKLHAGENIETNINNLKVASRTRNEIQKSFNTKLVLQQFLLETKV